MATRIATAAVGLPLLALFVWLGSHWFTALVAAAAAVATFELCGMARRWGDRPATPVALGGAVALVVGSHLVAYSFPAEAWVLGVAAASAGAALAWLLRGPRITSRLSVWTATLAPTLYVGGLLLHAPALRSLDEGRDWVLFLLFVTFATDSCAFFLGRALGRRALAPAISPSKTWEGVLGGLAGAMGASVASAYALGLHVAVPRALALGALLGAVGQMGDLAESRLKRIAGVKDSSWLLPGHGGLLDRLDSIVFNVVLVYYFVP